MRSSDYLCPQKEVYLYPYLIYIASLSTNRACIRMYMYSVLPSTVSIVSSTSATISAPYDKDLFSKFYTLASKYSVGLVDSRLAAGKRVDMYVSRPICKGYW